MPKFWSKVGLTEGLLIASLVLNAGLGIQTASDRRIIRARNSEGRLQVGLKLPPITATLVPGGTPTRIEFGKLPTLIYVFKPECGWCNKNAPNIKHLAKVTAGQYRLIGISLTDANLTHHISDHGFSFPVYTHVDEESIRAYKMGGTPQTILISEDGRVIRDWVGAYNGITGRLIEDYFHTHLPGFADARAAAGGKK